MNRNDDIDDDDAREPGEEGEIVLDHNNNSNNNNNNNNITNNTNAVSGASNPTHATAIGHPNNNNAFLHNTNTNNMNTTTNNTNGVPPLMASPRTTTTKPMSNSRDVYAVLSSSGGPLTQRLHHHSLLLGGGSGGRGERVGTTMGGAWRGRGGLLSRHTSLTTTGPNNNNTNNNLMDPSSSSSLIGSNTTNALLPPPPPRHHNHPHQQQQQQRSQSFSGVMSLTLSTRAAAASAASIPSTFSTTAGSGDTSSSSSRCSSNPMNPPNNSSSSSNSNNPNNRNTAHPRSLHIAIPTAATAAPRPTDPRFRGMTTPGSAATPSTTTPSTTPFDPVLPLPSTTTMAPATLLLGAHQQPPPLPPLSAAAASSDSPFPPRPAAAFSRGGTATVEHPSSFPTPKPPSLTAPPGHTATTTLLPPPPPPKPEDTSFRALADTADNTNINRSNNVFRRESFRGPSSVLADTSGDTNNNNMVGGTAFQQQRPIRRGSDQLGSLSFSSEQQQPGGSLPTSREHTSFRGNRRDCDFRDGPSSLSATSAANSNNSADGNRPLLFRSSTEGSDAAFPRGGVARVSSDSYYGPSGAALGSNSDFRRSPSQRGRPLFGANNHTNNSSSNAAAMAGSIGSGGGSNNSLPPPPLIGRQGSFPLQQQHGHHRRNDPRFVASGGGSVNDWSDAAFLPDVQRSQTTQHSRSSFMEGSDESSFKSSATEHSEIPAHRSSINNNNPLVLNRGTSDGDSFGRTREWMTNRTSPQSSPSLNNNRRPSGLKFFQQSPNEAPLPPLLPPTTVAATDTGALKESLLVPHPRETSSLTTVSVVERPPPLLTSALGAGLTDRAEKAVTDVNDVLGVAGVKLDTDKECLSKLPSKQHILQAIAKIDSTIKATQSKSEDRKKSLDEALEEERLQRQKAEEFAIAESRRQAELLLENEANKRNEKERAHEEEISQFISERNAVFEIEQSTALLDLATKLKVATEDADKKIRDAVNEQMITTADSFDKDIVKMRKEHEKAKQASKKTELRLSAVEKDYQGKAKVIKNDGLAASATAPASCNVVSRVIAENRRKAAEAHMNQLTFLSQDADLKELDIVYQEQANIKDPIAGKTAIEWAQMAKQVTGLADALYTELCEAPYFESNLKTHEIIAPMVKEFVRHKQHKLKKQWIQLAEEYEYRRTLHEKQLQSAVHTKDRPKKSVSVPVRHSIFEGGKPSQPSLESASSRTSTNPYRRARRGNEVRSEYEQEQIIAEIAVKEALEKRIMFGGTDLPRQIGSLERELNCQFVNTFNAQRVDVIEQERVLSFTNVWSDMEKAVFLDRWLQFPKDFKKIASYLRNKNTKDCVKFYYDSKQSVPYKGALREHIMRRKRRGEYQVWNATIEAALSVGIVIESGPSEEKPLIFLLPETDDTYFTRDFHPMKREVFDAMVIDEKLAADFNEDECDDAKKTGKARKRQREPIFVLDSMHAKFLKNHQEATTASTSLLKSQSRSSIAGSATDGNLTDDATRDDGALTPARRPPQKWSALEKKVFLETLEKNGRNWSMLSQAVGTKSISQIKNFFYDYKKQVGRGRGEKKLGKEDGLTKLSNRENDMITPPPDRMSPLEETPATSDFSLHEPPLNVRDPERQLPSFPSYQSLHPILTQSQQEMQQLPIPTLDQSQTSQQDQHNLHHHHYHIGSGDLLVAANVMQMDNVNNLPHSGTSTPDAMDLWAQAHQHALAQQDQLTEEAARRLLQHHSQSQHQQQQLLSLLPWVNSGQLSHSNSNSMQDHQQIQSLLQLQHHPQQQQQAQHRQQPQNNFSHLAAMGLGGLAALTNSPANMASLGQQQLHHQHHHPPQHLHSQRLHPHDHHQQHHSQQQHHHQQQQQQQHAHHHQRQSSHDAQLVLAQHLLNLQAQSGTSAADALSILARSLPDPNRNGNGNKQNGNFHGGGI